MRLPTEAAFNIAPDPPLAFEPQGDDDKSLFVSRGLGYSLLLAPNRVVMNKARSGGGTRHSVEMSVVGANTEAEGHALEPLRAKTNYLIGNDRAQWRTGVPNFARVQFDEVYPGIDLVYYDSRRGVRPSGPKALEYDFVVSPGADPSAIRLGFNGVRELSIDSDGGLLLDTPVGALRQGKPFAYQEIAGVTRQVAGRYALDRDNIVSFELGAYDPTHAVVIDPTLDASSFFGGDGVDSGNGVAVTPDGLVLYTVGTTSGGFPTLPDAFDSTPAGSSDCFVATWDLTSNEVISSTLIGGNGQEECTGIAIDSNGNAYLTGFTNSTDFPQSPPGVPPPGFNSVLTVVNPRGTDLLFSTVAGGAGGEDGLSIAIHELTQPASRGSIIIGTTGRTFSDDFPVTPDALQGGHGGGFFDAFVELHLFERNPVTGALALVNRSATYLGGAGEDLGHGIAITGARETEGGFDVDTVLGLTTSTTNFPTAGQGYTAGSDAYFAVHTSQLLRLENEQGAGFTPQTWDYAGGLANDRVEDVTFSPRLNSVATLISSNSLGLETTPGSVCTEYPGGGESMNLRVFRLGEELDFKLTPKGSGSEEATGWSTYLGSTGTDTGKAIAFDRNGCVVVVGSTTSSEYPVTADAPQTEYGGGTTDAVVTRICDNGTRIDMSTYLGGSGADVANGVVIDPFDQIVVGGTAGAGFPTTAGSPQPDFGGGAGDAFVAKLGQSFVSRDGLVSSAKFSQAEGGGISPQEILSEFGVMVGPEVGVGLMFDGDSSVLREIGGTQALVNGEAAPMVLASRFQSSFVAPADLLIAKGTAEDTATIQFVVDGDRSNTLTVPVVAANPGLFSLDASGTGQGAILNPDFSVNGQGNAAPSDSFISVFGTGGGTVDPPCPDGEVGPSAEPLPRLQLPTRALVNGEDAQVLFAGSAPQLVCGANQFVIAPANNPTGQEVTVQVCVNEACSNVVTAAFE